MAKTESSKQEEHAAKQFGGRRTPGSGNGWDKKNDMRTQRISFELKTTKHLSYSMKESELMKAERNAVVDGGREMAFIVDFPDSSWVTVSRPFFAEMVAAWLSKAE
jgi:hypothetical protein